MDYLFDLIPDEYKGQEFDRRLFAEKQVQWYNDTVGNLPDVDCDECKNKGSIMFLSESGEQMTRECCCMVQRRYIWNMRSSGLGEMYERCTFDGYTAEEEWQVKVKKMAMAYASADGNKWLIFSGNSGCGKTHLCTAICSELAKRGRIVKYVEWKRMLAKLQQTKYKELENELLIKELREVDVLYLDDFLKTAGNARPTDEALNYALEIVNTRYFRNKKTIISSEFMAKEIEAFDEALGSRIIEKAYQIQLNRDQNRNYRKKFEKF